jgi:hypothetical protein
MYTEEIEPMGGILTTAGSHYVTVPHMYSGPEDTTIHGGLGRREQGQKKKKKKKKKKAGPQTKKKTVPRTRERIAIGKGEGGLTDDINTPAIALAQKLELRRDVLQTVGKNNRQPTNQPRSPSVTTTRLALSHLHPRASTPWAGGALSVGVT